LTTSDRAYRLAYYADNREKFMQYQRDFRLRNPEKMLVVGAKKRAKVRGVPCTITHLDVHIPDVCPLLGIPLVRKNDGSMGAHGASPTLDEQVPGLGYIPGNVWVISYQANSMKRDATQEQLVAFARALLHYFDKKVSA
jgi:hypothetical protein